MHFGNLEQALQQNISNYFSLKIIPLPFYNSSRRLKIMKLLQFRLVVSKVKKEVRCPKCKKNLQDKDIDISFVGGNETELSLQCPGCHAGVKTVAHVGDVRQPVAAAAFAEDVKCLSPDDVVGISSALKGFEGDVNGLFL